MIAFFARSRFSIIDLFGCVLASDISHHYGFGWGLLALVSVGLLSAAADLKVRYG